MAETPKNKKIYTGFAAGYDLVMRDVDYDRWAEHVLDLMQDFGIKGKRILNLACGTGCTELAWSKRGYEVTGLDQSSEMIERAREKAPARLKDRFLVADMRTFELGRTFDLIFCLYDSLNYLTSPQDVQACFRKVASHLNPGGGFIFDIATEANILENFTNTTYAENFEDFAYIWDNEYNIRTKICRSDFHFFYREPDSRAFTRRSEVHYQRIYASRELVKWLKEAGLVYVASFDGFTKNPPASHSERIHFLSRRV
jgi:SAM-dependent methyltransferase